MSVPLLNDLVLVYGNAFGPPGYHRVVDVATQQSVDLNGGRSATENEHDACFLWEKHASPTLDQQQVLADVIVIPEGEHVPDDMRRLTRDVRAFDVPTHVYGRVMSMEECDNPITDVRVLSSDDALAEAESFKRISGAVGKSPENSLYFLWCRRKRARESALEEQSKLFQGTSSSSSSYSASSSSSSPSSSSSSSSTSSQVFDREEKNSGKSLEVMTVVEGLEWHVTQSDIESMHSAVTMCAREGGLNTQLVQLAVRCIQSHVIPREQRSNLFSYVLCPIIEHLGRLLQSDVASLPAAVLPTILRVLGGDSNCSYFYTHFGHDLDYVACDFRLRANNNAAKQQMTRSNYYASKPKVVQNTACRSVYVVDAVNRFDAVGGFEGLIRRLVPDAGSAFLFSFANTALAAVLLCQICEVLDSALMNNYIIRFHEALMLSIQHAKISTKQESDEALRLLRESIVPSVLRMIEIMKPKLLPSSSSFSIGKFSEISKFHLAHSMLCSTTLGVRITGASMLQSLVESAGARDEYQRQHSKQSYYYYETIVEKRKRLRLEKNQSEWLTTAALTNLCTDHNVVVALLQDPHPEILLRTNILISEISFRANLQTHIIQSVWSSYITTSPNSQLRTVLSKILIDAAPDFILETIEFIQHQASMVPFSQYDVGFVHMLRECAVQEMRVCSKRGSRTDPMIPSLLFRAVLTADENVDDKQGGKQGEAGDGRGGGGEGGEGRGGGDAVSRRGVAINMGARANADGAVCTATESAVSAVAIDALVHVLSKSKESVHSYVDECLSSAKKEKKSTHAVAHMLHLAQKLLSVLSAKKYSTSPAARKNVVNALVAEHDLMNFLTDDLVRFEAMAAPSPSLNEMDKRRDGLSVRFLFLTFIARNSTNSKGKITLTHVTLLWNTFLGGVIQDGGSMLRSGSSADAFLEWLCGVLPTEDEYDMAEQRVAQLPLQKNAADGIFQNVCVSVHIPQQCLKACIPYWMTAYF